MKNITLYFLPRRFSSIVLAGGFALIGFASNDLRADAINPLSTSTNLSWGTAGQGGSGVWDSTSANWWNGSNAVRWTSGLQARFAGPGGTVTVDGQQTVSQITFNSGDYRLEGGSLRPSGSLRFVCNTDGWVEVDTIWASSSNSTTIRKSGLATLHLGSSLFSANNLIIEEGSLRVTSWRVGSSSLVARLAATKATELILAPSTGRLSLAGLEGGALDGLVRADDGFPVTLSLTGATRLFDGRLTDAPGGDPLALTKSGSGTQHLRNWNTHTGLTSVTAGTLALSLGGTLESSPVRISGTGRLLLDNAVQAVSGRLGGGELTLVAGTLQVTGNSGVAVTEDLETLRFSRNANVTLDGAVDAPVLLRVEAVVQEAPGSLMVQGNGALELQSLPANFFLGPTILRDGSHWAATGESGQVIPFANYVSDLDVAGPGDHVDLADTSATLGESKTIASLRAERLSEEVSTFEIEDDATLSLATGGMLLAGGGRLTVNGGSIQAEGAAALQTYVDGTLVLDSTVEEGVPGMQLVKAGPGHLELTRPNTFTGNVSVVAGTLWVKKEAALGQGDEIQLVAGTLALPDTFSSSKKLVVPTNGSGRLEIPNGVATFRGIVNDGTLTASGPGPGSGTLHIAESGQSLGPLTLLGTNLRASDLVGGYLSLRDDRAEISGRIDRLSAWGDSRGSSILSIGGNEVAELEMDHLSGFSSSFSSGAAVAMVLECNIGPGGSDLLRVRESFQLSAAIGPETAVIAVRPREPELLEVGAKYPFVEFLNPDPQYAARFRLDSELHEAGWRVAFALEGNMLYLEVCAVPGMILPIADASGAPGWEWSTGGERPWVGEPYYLPSKRHAVRSGTLEIDTSNWIEAKVEGPGTLRFQWQHPSWPTAQATVSVGGETVITSNHSFFWQERTIQIPTGMHPVRWTLHNQLATSKPLPELWLSDVRFDPQSYEAWASWHGLKDTEARAEVDSQGAGVPNLLRYALGITPHENGRNRLPFTFVEPFLNNDSTEDFLTLTFDRASSVQGVAYFFEASSDLELWTLLPAENIVSVTDLGGGIERVVVRDGVSLTTSSARFLRLRVETVP